jgi:RNA polymerase sigma-70 factor (ECF subfamily)
MDDDELVSAVAGGDDGALRELFARHAPWMAARLRAVLPARDVEDVLQETFVAVWRGAAQYRSGGAGGWLWGIARRQAALWLRRRGRPEVLLSALETAAQRRGADPTEAVVLRADLAEAVEALGPLGSPQRETWRLMYVEDRPVAEVADLMGVPEGTVKSRAHQIRKLMRGVLRRHDPTGEGDAR